MWSSAATLFTSGAIADRFGRRRCFAIGLTVFTAASLACALSQSLVQLVVCRAVQAAGGALMTPASLAIIVNTFVNPVRRAQTLGVWSATAGLSTAAGPVIGGLLVNFGLAEHLLGQHPFWSRGPDRHEVPCGV
jgi:MFS family permease